MFDFIGDLFGSTTDLLGGGGSGGSGGGSGLFGLASKIFGGSDDDPWGMLGSPIFGSVIGAVGMELMREDPADAIKKAEKARLAAIRESSYGYTGKTKARHRGLPTGGASTPPRQESAAAKYLPGGQLV